MSLIGGRMSGPIILVAKSVKRALCLLSLLRHTVKGYFRCVVPAVRHYGTLSVLGRMVRLRFYTAVNTGSIPVGRTMRRDTASVALSQSRALSALTGILNSTLTNSLC